MDQLSVGIPALVAIAGLRTLLVEDSLMVGDAIVSILESAGLVVAGRAGSMAEADLLTGAQDFDVAVVDIEPYHEMSYGLIERLANRGVSVVIISIDELPSAQADKVAAVLPKPFRAVALLTVVRRIAAARYAAIAAKSPRQAACAVLR